MKPRRFFIPLVLLFSAFVYECLPGPLVLQAEGVSAEEPVEGAALKREQREEAEKDDPDSHSFLVGALLYVPNRALDLLDIFRLRLRVGPGFAAGARVTKVAELYAGTYASIFAGLPGPRLRETPKLPVGLESHNGASASVVDATVDGGIGPDYSPSEIGAGFHLAILGIDFGVDPVEVLDFATGLFTIDIREDDL